MANGFTASLTLVRMDARLLAILLALAFTLVWAMAEVLVTRLYQRYSLVQVESLRFATQFVLVLLFARPRAGVRAARPWRSRRPLLQVLRGLAVLGLPFGFAAAVYSGVSIPVALAGLWFAPLFALALSALVLRERVPAMLWLAALAGMGAALMLLAPPRPAVLADLFMPLLSGLSLAVYLVLTRLLRDEPVGTGLFHVAVVGLLVLLPFLPGLWVQPGLRDIVLLVSIGALSCLALWLIDRALRHGLPSQVAPLLYAHVLVIHWTPTLLQGHGPSSTLLLATGLMGLVLLTVWWRGAWRPGEVVA